ncbi:tetratricopeptide repeat-containing sensor histidine kinase [Fulvitalea axinellae]
MAQASEGDKVRELFRRVNTPGEEQQALSELFQLLENTKDDEIKTRVSITIGQHMNSKAKVDSALLFGWKSVELIGNRTDTLSLKRLSRAYNILAIANNIKGLWDESVKWHFKSSETAVKVGDSLMYYMSAHGVANIYRHQGKYQESLELFKECLSQKDNLRMLYASHINMGIIYTDLERYEDANRHTEKALALCVESGDIKGQIICGTNLGMNSTFLGKHREALVLLDDAITLAKNHEYQRLKLNAQIYKSKTLQALGWNLSAHATLMQVREGMSGYNYLNMEEEVFARLKDVALAMGNYKAAYDYLSESNRVSDSIQALQANKKLKEYEVKYETLKKEKKIEALNAEQSRKELEIRKQKESKRHMLFFFIIILVPVVGLLVVYYQKLRTQSLLAKQQEEISRHEIATLLKDQEIKLGKASIDGQISERKRLARELHDTIGGNLAAIKMRCAREADKNGFPSEIVDQIDDTYQMARTLSHSLIPKNLSATAFTSLLRESLEAFRTDTLSEIELSAYPEGEINTLEQNLQVEIFTIVRELVNNTSKHAEAGRIELSLTLVENSLNLLFEDDGKGFDLSKSNEGIGLQNMRKRVENLSGSFMIDSHPERGTLVNIEIPLSKDISEEENKAEVKIG